MAWRRTEEITEIIRKRRWSEAEARLVVTASQASGKSVSSFAREHGLRSSRIWRWLARLKGESKGGIPPFRGPKWGFATAFS
jgi:transposase-like protein